MSSVRLIGKTSGFTGTEYDGKSIDEVIAGIARISSSREINDLFKEPHKLIRHCLLNGHWSIFEMSNLIFEIKTSRAIGRELLRHGKMVGLQEFSQRYAPVPDFEEVEIRKQATNNRQSSSEVFDPEISAISDYTLGEYKTTASKLVKNFISLAQEVYQQLLNAGVARESARFISLECGETTLIMNFRVREIITFLNARLHNTAQKECRLVAQAIRDIFIQECPVISKGLYLFDNAENIHILDRLILEKYKVYNTVLERNAA